MEHHVHFFTKFTCMLPAITVDSLGKAARVRGATLPQEYQLCRALQNVSFCDHSWTTETLACEWLGVVCDENLKVIEIEWALRSLDGIISWRDFPHTLRNLYLGNYVGWGAEVNHLTGCLPMHELPFSLRELGIANNQFDGTLDLQNFPKELEHFDATNNSFVGSVVLHALPITMTHLYLGENSLSGTIDLTRLPPQMEVLCE